MSDHAGTSTAALAQLFSRIVTSRGGVVAGVVEYEGHLFARGTLPGIQEVRPNDKMQGGVALRANENQAVVHPYLYRLVCENGAIMPQILESRSIPLDGTAGDPMQAVQTTIEACCDPSVFTASVDQLRTTIHRTADFALMVMSLMTRLSGAGLRHPGILRMLMESWDAQDQTLFGMVNAITAAARQTPDPKTKWEMEEFAGILITQDVPMPQKPSRRALREPRGTFAGV